MFKFAIVSRDHAVYKTCFDAMANSFTNVELIYCGIDLPQDLAHEIQILLSEPDIAKSLLPHCKSLQWLQSTWAGNNALQHISQRDYRLSGTKGIFGAQMREFVFAYLLYFQRQLASFSELQAQKIWQSERVDTLSAKRLGIMGLGNIGCELATTAEHFGMHISAITTGKQPIDGVDYYSINELKRFAHECDFVVNLLPETALTIGICNAVFFESMKPSAVFINAGRGSILASDHVLIDALRNEHIKAAVLDVFTTEPLPPQHPFYRLKNCYITNHTAAVSAPEKVFTVFEQNLRNYLDQKPLNYEHDFIKGY